MESHSAPQRSTTLHRRAAEHFEVSRVLFLGICLDFHYFLGRVGFPKL